MATGQNWDWSGAEGEHFLVFETQMEEGYKYAGMISITFPFPSGC